MSDRKQAVNERLQPATLALKPMHWLAACKQGNLNPYLRAVAFSLAPPSSTFTGSGIRGFALAVWRLVGAGLRQCQLRLGSTTSIEPSKR